MAFQVAENLQFVITIVFIYMLAKFTPVSSVSHYWLKGLEFCVPPTDEYIEDLLKEKPRKKSKKRPPPEPDQKSVVLHLAQISSPCLQDHFFFEEFDLLVTSFALIVCTLLFYEIWGFLAPFIFSTDKRVLLQTSTIGSGILLAEIGYCTKLLLSIVKQAGSESYEMRYSLLLGICSSILCFFIVDAPESIMNFGLHTGFRDMLTVVHHNFPNFPTSIINFTIFRSVLSIVAGCFAGVTVYPGLRLARSHFLLLKDLKTDDFLSKFNFAVSVTSFAIPIICTVAWIDPLTRNLLVSMEGDEQGIMSNETYNDLRLLLLLFVCLLRLYLVRPYIHVYLNTALTYAEACLGCTEKKVLFLARDRMYGVYAYLCVAAVQLIAPIFLLLLFILEMKLKGGLRLVLWGTVPTVNHSVFTPLFIHGIFSFLTWWFMTWWFLVSVFGLIYEKKRHSEARV